MKDKKEKPKIEDKWQLRDYLRTFDVHSPQILEERASEIVSHVERIMGRYIGNGAPEEYVKYYLPPISKMRKAYEKKDFGFEFPLSMISLIASIDYE